MNPIFKIGDLINVVGDDIWKIEGIVVLDVWKEGVIVNHPLHGSGGFYNSEVELNPISRTPLFEALK